MMLGKNENVESDIKQRLTKILKLEQKTGFRDQVVIGGLEGCVRNYIGKADDPEDRECVLELVKIFESYGSASLDHRAKQISKALASLETGRFATNEGIQTRTD